MSPNPENFAPKLDKLFKENLSTERAKKLTEALSSFLAERQRLSAETAMELDTDRDEQVDSLLDGLLEGKMEKDEVAATILALENILVGELELEDQKMNLTQAPGFAKEIVRTPDAVEALKKMSIADKLALIKEVMAAREVPKDKAIRLAQLSLIKLTLEAAADNYRSHNTEGQYFEALLEKRGDHTSAVDAMRVQHMINSLNRVDQEILSSDKTLAELIDPEILKFLYDGALQGSEEQKTEKQQSLKGFIEEKIDPKTGKKSYKLIEAANHDQLMKYALAAVDYMRFDVGSYDIAENLITNDLLADEFKTARESYFDEDPNFPEAKLKRYRVIVQELDKMWDKKQRGRYFDVKKYAELQKELMTFHYPAGEDQPPTRGGEREGLRTALDRYDQKKQIEKQARISVMAATRTPEAKEIWDKSMSPEAQKLYREHLIKLTTERALNQHVAKASGNTLNQNLSGVKAQLMERYLRIADTGDFYQMSDRRFDQITHELIINAPLIIASGLAMSAMRAALSRGAVAAAESGALGEGLVVARIANGARKVVLAESAGFGSKALYAGGRLGGLLAGAATFDLAHTGMQEPEQIDELLEQLYDHTFGTPKEKQYLRDLPAWGKSILWTAATVGAFEFTGKVTNEFVDALLKGSKLFPEKSIQLAVAKLVANGHTETATMLVMGGLQHFVAKDGDMSEFDTIENLIHALISVGALKIVGGAPKVVIATVRGLRGKEPEGPEGPGEAPKKEIEEVKVAERAPEKAKAEPATAERVSLEEALEKGGEVTVSKPEDLMGTLDRLDGEGYKLEPSEGGAVAKKPGKPDIILKESGELARQSKEAERLMNSVRENPTPENMEAAESGLIRLFGAPRSLARLMIAMAAGLIPETAFAGGKGIFETGLLGTFFRFFLGDVSNYAVDKGLDSLAGITMGLLSSKLFWMIVFYRSLRRYPTAKAKKGAQDLYDNQLDTAVTPQTVPSFEAAIAPLKRALKIIKKHILWEPLMNRIRSETPKEIVALAQEKLALVEQLISDYNTALKKGEDVSPIATKMRTALTDLGNAIDSIPIGILGHVFGLVGGRVDLGGVGRGVGNLASGALNQVARHRLLAVLLAAAAALGVGGYKFRHELGWKDKVTHIGPSGEIEVIGPTNIKIDYIYVGQGRNMPDLKVKVKPKFKTINEGESNEAYIYESLDGKKYIIYKSGDGSGVPYNR